jgi:flagellar protein FlgJ
VQSAAQINALDPRALGDIKRLERDNSPESMAAAAKQFEALFLGMVLKSMREANFGGGIFDNEQSRMYQSLLDQQLAQNMAQAGGAGLAKALLRQLEAGKGGGTDADTEGGQLPPVDLRSLPRLPARTAAHPATAETLAAGPQQILPPATAANAPAGVDEVPQLRPEVQDFVDRVWPDAVAASRETGIPAHFMVAQAALETGWGRSELRHADGRSSHNLFNIKTGAGWSGAAVETRTTEFINGRSTSESARFRAYGSYAESFRDYARLLRDNPRFAAVLGQTDAAGFARSLQSAGYATDPLYADKLQRIINGDTLRAALTG